MSDDKARQGIQTLSLFKRWFPNPWLRIPVQAILAIIVVWLAIVISSFAANLVVGVRCWMEPERLGCPGWSPKKSERPAAPDLHERIQATASVAGSSSAVTPA